MYKKAFTLIELLVVIAIVGILAGIVIVSMAGATDSANDAKRKLTVSTIAKNIMIYGVSNGGIYPIQSTVCNLGSNCTNVSSALSTIMPSIPTDPISGRYYQYFSNANGTSFTVFSVLSSGQFAMGSNNSCETDWVDSGYGFCVMKYEARNNGSNLPVSQSSGSPWTSITQTAAIAACSSLGNGAHLITNAEWTLLARSIESVPANWTGGGVGSGILKRGNVGITDAGSYDGADPDTGISNNLAELVLSNGQSIWHLSGNVWEWTNDTCTAGTGTGNWYNSGTWIDWNNSNLTDYEKYIAGPSGNFIGDNGVGRYYGCSANSNAVLRGGIWDHGTYSGVFTLSLVDPPTTSATGIGFRCAK
jgi:prepilin-type N-terminal cleavage/methylation domain-containing protein